MKTNKAPEKIYILNHTDYSDRRILNAFTEKENNNDIEYTRTDAFIEKLECWMNENFYQYAGEFAEGILTQFDRTEDCIEDFKKYMKGE